VPSRVPRPLAPRTLQLASLSFGLAIRLVSDIIDLADSASDTLGFLPMEVFQEAARKQILLTAMRGKELCGYALFALPKQYIRLTHLWIAPEFCGHGLARRLIITTASKWCDGVVGSWHGR
jgi:ribosomal protein S18 acetylase RimI-like enzyme